MVVAWCYTGHHHRNILLVVHHHAVRPAGCPIGDRFSCAASTRPLQHLFPAFSRPTDLSPPPACESSRSLVATCAFSDFAACFVFFPFYFFCFHCVAFAFALSSPVNKGDAQDEQVLGDGVSVEACGKVQ